jgi:hypothetical protein
MKSELTGAHSAVSARLCELAIPMFAVFSFFYVASSVYKPCTTTQREEKENSGILRLISLIWGTFSLLAKGYEGLF